MQPGELAVTDADTWTCATAGRGDIWIGLAAEPGAWSRFLQNCPRSVIADPTLLPERHGASPELRRQADRLAQASSEGAAEAAVHALIESIVELQNPMAAMIARCPGRTYRRRLRTFLSLQRVRRYMASNCHREIDTAMLAKLAHYSPAWFIRVFHKTYVETPHAFLTNQRMLRAHELVRGSELAIAEIAQATGFGDRSSFSRLFRRRFGVPAAVVRRWRDRQAPDVRDGAWEGANPA
ncbi:MAG TPA: helix-turn-helix transcriptional regulator [Rudaea sp.]|nr:helix-turn-helix transcriptional regulator [Rudaea sp.]